MRVTARGCTEVERKATAAYRSGGGVNWKFWKKPDAVPNPRGKRYRGDPVWVLNLTQLMRYVNAGMLAVIIVSTMLLIAVKQ